MDESNADENIFLISVIMPVYNTAEYLRNSVDNILSASIHGLELILVNDGSDDGSGDICRSYSEMYPCVKVCEQANLGPSAARNKGLELARGEYVAFVDADDYIDPEAFKKNLSFLRNSKADVWVSDFFRVADNGCILDSISQIEPTNEPIIGREYLSSFLSTKDCVWNVWRYIFNRKFVEENKLRFYVGYDIGEDICFVVKALSMCKCPAFFHTPYYNCRVNYGEGLTRRYSTERVRQLMRMLERAYWCMGDDEVAALFQAKIAQEYILNLSLLYEVPKEDRHLTLRHLKISESLANGASGVYSIADMALRTLGFRISAAMMLAIKRMKRRK